MRQRVGTILIIVGCVCMNQVQVKQDILVWIVQYCFIQYWPVFIVGFGLLLHASQKEKHKKRNT